MLTDRTLLESDSYCPSCGHNRDASLVSSISLENGGKSCQMCGATWAEVRVEALPQGPVMHAPSGAVFDSVVAAIEPDDLVALTPQPPAPCLKCAEAERIEAIAAANLGEEIIKNGTLQSKVAEQSAEIERYQNDQMRLVDNSRILVFQNHDLTNKNEQQAERIAELEAKEFDWAKANAKCTDAIAKQAALIERCEKAIERIFGSIMSIHNGQPVRVITPYDYDKVLEALTAIAAHKS